VNYAKFIRQQRVSELSRGWKRKRKPRQTDKGRGNPKNTQTHIHMHTYTHAYEAGPYRNRYLRKFRTSSPWIF